jgi:enolase
LELNEELDGDTGAAFAIGANVGMATSVANTKAAIRAFMTRLHDWGHCDSIV